MRFALRHPMLAMQFEFARRDEDPQRRLARVRTMLMGERTPDALVARMITLLQQESRRALRELSTQSLPARPLGIPTLVLAGGQDQLIGVPAQKRMAADYDAPIEVFPAMGHMLSLEPGWQLVADAIASFLERHLPAQASGAA
jgi:pimeloyl-ACP methyl ester carboxylesterase